MILNYNQACVNWSKICTTKGQWHIQIKENHVPENIADHFVEKSICKRNERYQTFL
jgi:hypothetical protein